MGVWGTGIFQDDTACDLRDDYRDYLGQGLSGPAATERILADFKSSLADPSEAGVIWLALAATQWKLGRLDPEILAHALEVIDSGADLKRWNVDPKDLSKRKALLEKLRVQITSPQPLPVKVRREVKSECDWQVGELVAYRLDSGRLVILRVMGHKTDKGGTYPYCEFLDWIGSDLPSHEVLVSLPPRWGRTPFTEVKQLMIVGMNRKWAKRTQRLDIQSTPSPRSQTATVIQWKQMDRIAKEWFQLE